MGRRRRTLLRCSPSLAGLLAVLSLLLFSWGLAYKLSLYGSHELPPKMVAAKLLSQKERPVTAQSSEVLPPIVPGSAFGSTPLPSIHLLSLMHVPALELRSAYLRDARQLFTIHTGRKPPPSVAG